MATKGWKTYRAFLNKSKTEFDTYTRTGDVKKLAQAGEKLWNAFNLFVQKKSGKKIRSYSQLKKEVSEIYTQSGSELLLRTFKKCYDLHIFFYRGYTEDVKDIENDYLEAYESILILEKSLNRRR